MCGVRMASMASSVGLAEQDIERRQRHVVVVRMKAEPRANRHLAGARPEQILQRAPFRCRTRRAPSSSSVFQLLFGGEHEPAELGDDLEMLDQRIVDRDAVGRMEQPAARLRSVGDVQRLRDVAIGHHLGDARDGAAPARSSDGEDGVSVTTHVVSLRQPWHTEGMGFMTSRVLMPIVARLGSRTIIGVGGTLFLLNMLIPDPLPLVDEFLILAGTILLSRMAKRSVNRVRQVQQVQRVQQVRAGAGPKPVGRGSTQTSNRSSGD